MFAATAKPGNDTFDIRLGPAGHNYEKYTADELWQALQGWLSDETADECERECDPDSGCRAECRRDLAGSVMCVLGFEWI